MIRERVAGRPVYRSEPRRVTPAEYGQVLTMAAQWPVDHIQLIDMVLEGGLPLVDTGLLDPDGLRVTLAELASQPYDEEFHSPSGSRRLRWIRYRIRWAAKSPFSWLAVGPI